MWLGGVAERSVRPLAVVNEGVNDPTELATGQVRNKEVGGQERSVVANAKQHIHMRARLDERENSTHNSR